MMLTTTDLLHVKRAALTVWDYIASDTLACVAEDTVSCGDVIEMVCDANRLEAELTRLGHAALAEQIRVMPYRELKLLLRQNVFRFRRYGL